MAQVKLLKIATNVPTETDGTADDVTFLSLTTDTISERTATAGVTADGTLLKDGGIDLAASASLSVNGTGILVDAAGTMTLSNVDALDATTETTIEAAIDTLANLTSASSLATVGALNSGSITSGFGSIDNGASAITTTGDITGGGIIATGDTAPGDLAAMGYSATNGLVLTGQGSLGDVTLKNDLGSSVMYIPTGTTGATFGGAITATTGPITGPSGTWDTGGIDIATADSYAINGTDVLTATVLGSTVVTSSLTTVGTIATGVWSATDVAVDAGGSGRSDALAYAVICGGTTSTAAHQSIASVGSSGEVLTSNGAGALPTFQATGSASNLETYTNGNGGTISKGDVVYMTATADNVDLADADTVAQGNTIVGLVADATILTTASGNIHVARGKTITGVLTGATAGTIYYLDTVTPGGMTTSAPSGGPALVRVGFAKNTTDLVFDPQFIADTTA